MGIAEGVLEASSRNSNQPLLPSLSPSFLPSFLFSLSLHSVVPYSFLPSLFPSISQILNAYYILGSNILASEDVKNK